MSFYAASFTSSPHIPLYSQYTNIQPRFGVKTSWSMPFVTWNRWRRRFALICTIPPNHKGRKNPQLAIRIAKPLMNDEDPMVYKAVGFALREACRAGGEDEVFEFLLSVRDRAYRRTITESAKKLSAAHKKRLVG
jgi:3-methyladenine DNA glycosylase AlkD